MKKQDNIKIEGKDYALQNPGSKWYFDLMDESTENGSIQQRLIYISYLEHVVVDPRLEIKEFDDMKGNVKNIKFNESSFSIKHPGIEKFLDIISNTEHSLTEERIAYMDLITYKNEKLTFDVIDDLEDGFNSLSQLIDECKSYALEGKAGLLNQLMAECERFLTGQKQRYSVLPEKSTG